MQEQPVSHSQSVNLDSNSCPACQRVFKSQRGIRIHQRACKGERAEELKIKGLEPLFLKWEKRDGKRVSVKEKKQWRDGIRVWLMRRAKQEMNLGLAALNPQNQRLENDHHIHDALVLAGKTIVPCLMGDHTNCDAESKGCGGDEAVPEYDSLPSNGPLTSVPEQTVSWLNSIVDAVLGRDALQTCVVNGRKGTTSLVESVHRQIRLPIPKGRMHARNDTNLIKSGTFTILEMTLTLLINTLTHISKNLGVHSAAKQSQPLGILLHLKKLKVPVSEQQQQRLLRMHRANKVQKKYRMSKVSISYCNSTFTS